MRELAEMLETETSASNIEVHSTAARGQADLTAPNAAKQEFLCSSST